MFFAFQQVVEAMLQNPTWGMAPLTQSQVTIHPVVGMEYVNIKIKGEGVVFEIEWE